MRYDRESWRKLYREEPFDQLAWPVMARGIRDLLVRKPADESGTLIPSTQDPVSDLVRVLAPTDAESELVRTAIEILIADGYLKHDPETGRLWIRNYASAQRARSKDAIRKAKERADKRRTRPGHVQQKSTPRNVDTSGTRPLDETRRDEKIPLPPNEDDLSPGPGRPDPLAHMRGTAPGQRADVKRVHARWRERCGYPNARFRGPHDANAATIAEAVDTYGEPACLKVADAAPHDGMVSGKADERGQKHDSIGYVFGNAAAFDRILRDAEKRDRERDRTGGKSVAEIIAAAKGRPCN